MLIIKITNFGTQVLKIELLLNIYYPILKINLKIKTKISVIGENLFLKMKLKTNEPSMNYNIFFYLAK